MEVGFQGARVEPTFAHLVVMQTVRVYKNPAVTLELLALGGGAQLGSAGLGESLLLFTGPPAERTGKQVSGTLPSAGLLHKTPILSFMLRVEDLGDGQSELTTYNPHR